MMNHHNNHTSIAHYPKTKPEVRPTAVRVQIQQNGVAPVACEEEALLNRRLPKELLLRIFSYLDVVTLCRCAQVSRYWNILALDGSNWQRVDLFDFQTDVEGPVVENISRRCGGFLKSLSLRGCQSITDAALKTFSQQCHNIEFLNLSGCKRITDATCLSLGKHCPKLLHLDLDSCPSISNKSLIALSEGCHGLSHLNISWCEEITDEGVAAISRGCTQLRAFICKGCTQLTDHGFLQIAEKCQELRTLNMHSCNEYMRARVLYSAVYEKQSLLCSVVDDNQSFIWYFESTVYNVRDETIVTLSEGCPNLCTLCVSNCTHLTDASLVALGQGCHELRTLEVSGCSQFTDSGFQALAKNCHQLERMDLEECVQINDATLGHLAMHCPRLSKLSLSHCELISDEGIRLLGGSHCAMESLTVLELDNCPLISDASMEHLMSCQNLQRIELYDCQLITRAGIRRLRSHLPGLMVHAYFAPVTPPHSAPNHRHRYCKCCVIL